ncbi:MAG: hypothetical protein AB1585_13350 [Thermodesulfobacteriota bacterium]
MKKLLILFIVAVSLISTFTISVISEETQTVCLFEQNANLNPFADPERRGCCSWHGGVCGCTSGGRAICCDGTISPSCGC